MGAKETAGPGELGVPPKSGSSAIGEDARAIGDDPIANKNSVVHAVARKFAVSLDANDLVLKALVNRSFIAAE